MGKNASAKIEAATDANLNEPGESPVKDGAPVSVQQAALAISEPDAANVQDVALQGSAEIDGASALVKAELEDGNVVLHYSNGGKVVMAEGSDVLGGALSKDALSMIAEFLLEEEAEPLETAAGPGQPPVPQGGGSSIYADKAGSLMDLIDPTEDTLPGILGPDPRVGPENHGLRFSGKTLPEVAEAIADAPVVTAAPAVGGEGRAIPLSLQVELTDQDGSESIVSIVIENIPAGVLLSDGGKAFTADAENGSVDVVGWDLESLFLVTPVGITGDIRLGVTATSEEADNGDQASSSSAIDVHVDAVADAPDLTVEAAQAPGVAIDGTAANNALTGTGGDDAMTGFGGNDLLRGFLGDDILSGGDGRDTIYGNHSNSSAAQSQSLSYTLDIAAVFPDVDGSEVHSLEVSGLPAGAALSAGSDQGGGLWLLTPEQLAGLSLQMPASAGGFTLTVTARAEEFANGDTAETVQSVEIVVPSDDDSISGGDGNDRLYGQGGDDMIHGDGGNDLLYGGTGNDALHGGDGNDRLYGQGGDDLIHGDGGNDRLYGGTGNDALHGGDGADRAYGEAGDDVIRGDGGRDRLYGQDGEDDIQGGADHDYLYGGAGNDALDGGDGNDYLRGDAGADRLIGGAGSDRLVIDAADTAAGLVDGGSGFDRVYVSGAAGVSLDMTAASIEQAYGNLGGDTFDARGHLAAIRQYGRAGDDSLLGGTKADRIYGEAGDDVIHGEGGADRLYGGGDDDAVYGGDGGDRLYGQGGGDLLQGDGGNDYLYGGGGDDSLQGNDGNDYLRGDAGADILVGGDGNDRLVFDAADSVIDGGSGTDSAYVSGNAGVSLDMTAGSIERAYGRDGDDTFDASGQTAATRQYGRGGDDSLTGGSQADYLRGDGGDDLLIGGDANDVLLGGTGMDRLLGEAGNDYLRGDAGADILVGGDGNDRLLGGAGQDSYVWLNDETGSDRVYGFAAGPGEDILDLADLLDGDPVAAPDVLDAYLSFSKSGSSTVLRVDADGDGGGTDQTIILSGADLTGSGSLTDEDIIGNLLNDGQLIV